MAPVICVTDSSPEKARRSMRFQRPVGVSGELLLKFAYASAHEPGALLLLRRLDVPGGVSASNASQASAVRFSSERSRIFW